jgi:hypothetical protein
MSASEPVAEVPAAAAVLVADYAFTHPAVAKLQAAKIGAAGRYYGQAGPPKNLTSAEAQLLTAAGIDIVSIFEFGAQQALGGAAQAIIDVALFKAQRAATGMPADRPVYFAADFDVPDYAPGLANLPVNAKAKLGPLAAYWAVIHNDLGPLSGAYGGYWLVKRLFDAGLISWGFQTIAWSGGQWDARACLRQTGATELGGAADVDVPERADFGQWTLAAPKPPPPKEPPVPGTWKSLISVNRTATGWEAVGVGTNDALYVIATTGVNPDGTFAWGQPHRITPGPVVFAP